ncbi:uncharacterized protein UTRI_02232_B [Ustilago trichophora]|uniref:Rhodanese domain-containing protein n=1 Tax=Ustilago trichophora TaxID=86804 RepID=A0A5C3DUR6_9BASI|nr:uncharacterized protein UTRI_02232_B [Ustilago trichophora]
MSAATDAKEHTIDTSDDRALEAYLSLKVPRLVLDLRPDSAFHQAHIANSYHISSVSELKSRYSYLPPRNVPFLVIADQEQLREVVEAFSSTPSARLLFLSASTLSNSSEQQVHSDSNPTQTLSCNIFFDSAQRLGLVRSSASHRERITLPPRSSSNHGHDFPQLLFRPSNAVHRSVLNLETNTHRDGALRVLDLGCGAARDLAWILHGSRTRPSSRTWTGVGVDNWKAVLKRAQQLIEDLYLNSRQPVLSSQASSAAPFCEKLLWAKCSDDGFLEPLTGTGKGKSIQTASDDEQLWGEYLQAGLAPLLPGADNGEESNSVDAKFDLILCIRFHPRALLPRLSHLVRIGGIVLLSHFVTLSEAEREAAIQAHPQATIDYDSPPPEGRIQPGEIESLIGAWNASAVEAGLTWTIESQVLEPIEDGRIIKSVALRKVKAAAAV